MIPRDVHIKKLWDKYNVPQKKRVHMDLVARVAMVFAKKLNAKSYKLNTDLLFAAALLHDIDKAVGGKHPDTAVRILNQEGYSEVAAIVKTHSLHSILDPTSGPQTLEEKILYLSDKMVKYDIVGVDGRFALWRAENLPEEAREILDATYPKVKALEKEMFSIANLTLDDIIRLV